MEYYNKTFSALTSANHTFSQEELILRLQKFKPKIGELRKNFRKFPCSIDYFDSEVRAAYLMSYYPYYITPIIRILEEVEAKSSLVFSKESIKVTAFGCGAAPEIIGVSEFLVKNDLPVNTMINNLLDYEMGWENSREILMNEFLSENFEYINNHQKCNLLIDCDKCSDNYLCKAKLSNSNLIIIQNCLNEISDKIKMEKIHFILKNYLHEEGILVIIDLCFNEIKNLMISLEKVFKENVILSTRKFTEKAEFAIPNFIQDYIFDGSENFILKRSTHFYSIVLKKF